MVRVCVCQQTSVRLTVQSYAGFCKILIIPFSFFLLSGRRRLLVNDDAGFVLFFFSAVFLVFSFCLVKRSVFVVAGCSSCIFSPSRCRSLVEIFESYSEVLVRLIKFDEKTASVLLFMVICQVPIVFGVFFFVCFKNVPVKE